MDSPDADRRASRSIGRLRTVPPDVTPGSVLTVRADRTFGWLPPQMPDGVQRKLPPAPRNGMVWTSTPNGNAWSAPSVPAGAVSQIEYRDGIGVPAITSLLGLSASVDVAVTWSTPFPDDQYTIVKPQVSATSASLIGKTDAVVKSKTAAGCVVTVTATALLSTGTCTLGVLAYRKG